MANAQVEKLKALGLRHGEKAGVAIAGTLCLLFLFFAVTKPTIDLTADQVASDAKAAAANIDRAQDTEDILKRLEEEGLKAPGFEKLVDAQEKQQLSASEYVVSKPWVTPEPGAGLIRDQPKLIAPIELVAYPGRGGARIFELDETGKRIKEDPNAKKPDDHTAKRRLGKRRRGAGGMMGSMMGMAGMGGMPGMGGGMPGEETDEMKKERIRKEKQLKGLLAGKGGPMDKSKKEKPKEGEEEEAEEAGPFKEITRGLRWVSITGVLDHKQMRDNYLAALKNPAVAHPNYKQLDVQRQVKEHDGSWSDWEDVDIEANRKVVFNLPEEDEELTPDNVRIGRLVDPLPFLTAGYWEKVHVVSLVPKEKVEVAKPSGGMGGMGMMSMAGSGAGDSGMMMSGGMPGGMGGKFGGSMAMMGGSGGGDMPGMMGMGGMGGGGATETLDFQKSEEDTIMIRSLDFTARPDTTYRFRLRIVVFNPNYNREDVSPGVDNKSLELQGPWSEATEEVTMPPDVTAYAIRKAPAAQGSKRTDQVDYQVTRWNPDDGVTVVRNFTAGPGEIIGEPATAEVPVSDGTGAKRKLIDFNSRQIVLDTEGGMRTLSAVGTGGQLDVPALSLMLRPDGSVLVRSQTSDYVDPVRKDMADNYKREVKESSTQRNNSMGSMYGGMMGGMGSGMGR